MGSDQTSKSIILAALDRSPECARVAELAFAMARMLPRAELHFVHVIDTGWSSEPLPRKFLEQQGASFLSRAVARPDDLAVFTHLEDGQPAKQILALATRLAAGLVIVGAHAHGLSRLVLGSVSGKVAHEALCPVLIARETAYPAVPAIEPPCPACVEARTASNGEVFWCAQHTAHHVHGHTYRETPEPFAVGSMLFRPEG